MAKADRSALWQNLNNASALDVIVIGGGITGAGVLREAARRGLNAVLLEQGDFASGTSSRSSKLVHGGLRYLKQGHIKLIRDAVTERQKLLNQAPGLVTPQNFIMPHFEDQKPSARTMRVGLKVYDALAGIRSAQKLPVPQLLDHLPDLATHKLQSGSGYMDAQTDDSRLVYRVLHEARADGARVVNYARVTKLVRNGQTTVGVLVEDQLHNHPPVELKAKAIINATGAWANHLRSQTGQQTKLRPLRGSHLLFPLSRLPLEHAVGFMHPADQRPVFAYPWEGAALLGTTDVDHDQDLNQEPALTQTEASYLLEAVNWAFPRLKLTNTDVISSYAGVRPVIDTGADDPSKESREHEIWHDDGLVTIAGGKLTTFRLIALDALNQVHERLGLPKLKPGDEILRGTEELSTTLALSSTQKQRLLGRYGNAAHALVQQADPSLFSHIEHTPTLWAELPWIAANEQIVHLDDLMLRRTRLGLLLGTGGKAQLPRIRQLCQKRLGWSDEHWQTEEQRYRELWRKHYAPPTIKAPDQHD